MTPTASEPRRACWRARSRVRLREDGRLDEGDPGSEVRRYAYKKGAAVVFGSKFMHSTEPGAGRNGEPYAYLCFTFGTTDMAAWPQVRARRACAKRAGRAVPP